MYLIDTCVLSEATRPAPDVGVDRWLKARDADELFTSAIAAGELRYGIERLPKGRRRDALERWYSETFLAGFASRVLSFDLASAECWAEIRAAHPAASTVGSQIAAMALAKRLVLVTRNVKDFAFAGLPVFNPWKD